ncbi:phosphatase PAP2 family protein, partial [uncultured Dubosiella sp.]
MNWDGGILLWLQDHVRHVGLDTIVLWITNSIPFVAGLFVVLLCFKKTRRFAIFALASLAICLACNAFVIKPFFSRIRPFIAIPGLDLLGPVPGGSSFPSSHTTAVFALAWMSLWCKQKKWTILLFAYAIVVALSRLYLGVHYPTDVLGGILVACVLSWLTYRALKAVGAK